MFKITNTKLRTAQICIAPHYNQELTNHLQHNGLIDPLPPHAPVSRSERAKGKTGGRTEQLGRTGDRRRQRRSQPRPKLSRERAPGTALREIRITSFGLDATECDAGVWMDAKCKTEINCCGPHSKRGHCAL